MRSFTAELGKSNVVKGARELGSREVSRQGSKGARELKTIGDFLNYFLPCTLILLLPDQDNSLPSCSLAVPPESEHLTPGHGRGMSPRRSCQLGFHGSKLDEIALEKRRGKGKKNLSFSGSPFSFVLPGVINIFDPNLLPMLSADPSLSPLTSILKVRPEIIVIGTSLGGLHALEVLLAGLPQNLPVPVAIVQHRHKDSDNSLCVFLQAQCALPIKEAEDKEAIVPGCIYLAPADYHLLVEAGDLREDWQSKHQAGAHHTFALSTEAPVLYARPSINVLFESAAEAYGKKVLGVILTGASNDGTQGLLKIKASGGLAVVQDPTTAASPTMPKAAIAAVAVDWILPLRDIAPFIVNLCHPALR